MYSEHFRELKEAYQKDRSTEFSDEQFAALVYTFPSILVAYADGRIDSEERNFLKGIPRELLSAYIDAENGHRHLNEEISFNDDYFKEIKHLIRQLKQWEAPFIETLRHELQNDQNDKNAIYELMWRTADSSADISQEEVAGIRELSTRLGL